MVSEELMVDDYVNTSDVDNITQLLRLMGEVRHLCRELDLPYMIDLALFAKVVERCSLEVHHTLVAQEMFASFKNKSEVQ